MSIEHLQELIRSCKTPIALQLNPDLERVSPKIRKNFTDLYGDCPMSRAETLRYHGSQLISLAAGKLPAVLLRADCYLRCGFMGMDVLSNLVNMAKNQGMYTIIDARTVYPDVWVGGEVNADGVTVMPYIGSDCCAVSEGKAAFAAVRTANPSAAQLQNLMAGDRKLYAAAAGQMARHGAALLVEMGYSLDIKELRRRAEKSFLLLTGCDGENALPAFDDYGHGALLADGDLQYAEKPAEAIDEAIRRMKQLVPVL